MSISANDFTVAGFSDSEARNAALYSSIVESNSDLICRYLPDGRLTFVNAAYCRYFEKSKEELLGKTFTPRVPAEDHLIIEEMMAALREGGGPYTHEHRVINAQGEVRWTQWINAPICDRAGRLLEYQAIGRDVTGLKTAQAELKRLSGELLRLQDAERKRLARELHDTTTQKITALALNLRLVQATNSKLAPAEQSALGEALRMAEEAIRELRTFSYVLYPAELELLGLPGAIRDFVGGFSNRTGIRVTLALDEAFPRMNTDVETALFRVVQEGLANVHRHSGSPSAEIGLRLEDGRIVLEIRDFGCGGERGVEGGELGSGRRGVGIAGMRERIAVIGGEFEAVFGRDGVTLRAVVKVPIGIKKD